MGTICGQMFGDNGAIQAVWGQLLRSNGGQFIVTIWGKYLMTMGIIWGQCERGDNVCMGAIIDYIR